MQNFLFKATLHFIVFTSLCTQLFSQTDTILTLPVVNIYDANFEPAGYSSWRADSVPVITPVSLAERLMWETPLVVRANAPGTLATISARGIGAARTPVFWQGLNLQSPMNGVVDVALLPVFPTDDVTLRYGGQSSVLSTGAMGGSVLVTPRPSTSEGWGGWLSAGAGSFQTFRGLALVHANFEKSHNELRLSGRMAENDFPFRNTARAGAPEQRQVQNAGEQWDAQYFGTFGNVSVSAWHQQAFRELPPTMVQAPADTWQRDRATRAVVQWTPGKWLHRAAWLDEYIEYYNVGFSDESRSRTALLATEYAGTWGARFLYRVGGQGIRQEARADGYADSTTFFGQWRAAGFVMGEYVAGPWRFSLLVRQEYAEDQGEPFTWSAGVQFDTRTSGLLHFHVSRNFTLPTFNDRFWRTLGNRDLRTESGYSSELGWNWQNDGWQMDISSFFLLVDDWIQWQPGPDGLFRPNNVQQVLSLGGEMGGYWKWKTGKIHGRVGGQGQLLMANVQKNYVNSAITSGGQLPYTPMLIASGNIHIGGKNWSAAYLQQYTGNRYTTSDQSGFLPGYHTGILLLAGNWKRWQLEGRIENIWDQEYQSIAFRPMPGRSFFLSMGVKI